MQRERFINVVKLRYIIKKERQKEMERLTKKILLPVFAVLVLVSFVAMVSGATFVNIKTPAINFTNISGSAYTLTAYINESAATVYIGNVTWYYKPLSHAIPGNDTWFLIGTTENTSDNQSIFTITWDTTARTEAEDYMINATAMNYAIIGADFVNSTNITGNVTKSAPMIA